MVFSVVVYHECWFFSFVPFNTAAVVAAAAAVVVVHFGIYYISLRSMCNRACSLSVLLFVSSLVCDRMKKSHCILFFSFAWLRELWMFSLAPKLCTYFSAFSAGVTIESKTFVKLFTIYYISSVWFQNDFFFLIILFVSIRFNHHYYEAPNIRFESIVRVNHNIFVVSSNVFENENWVICCVSIVSTALWNM